MELIKITTLDGELRPRRAHPTDAGLDLFAAEQCLIRAGSRCLVDTGIHISIPEGYYGHVCPRSGLAVRGIDIGAGIIDSGYTGRVKVLMIYNGDETEFLVKKYDKIAQLLVLKCDISTPQVMIGGPELLDKTERGESGFGSTDKLPLHNSTPSVIFGTPPELLDKTECGEYTEYGGIIRDHLDRIVSIGVNAVGYLDSPFNSIEDQVEDQVEDNLNN